MSLIFSRKEIVNANKDAVTVVGNTIYWSQSCISRHVTCVCLLQLRCHLCQEHRNGKCICHDIRIMILIGDQLLAFRFLTGFFGSPVLATGGATITDMYSPAKRAYALSIFGISNILGPVSSSQAMNPHVRTNQMTDNWTYSRKLCRRIQGLDVAHMGVGLDLWIHAGLLDLLLPGDFSR